MSEIGQRSFERIGNVSERVGKPLRPWFDRLFARFLPETSVNGRLDWAADADWALIQEEPLRARMLLRVVAVVLLLLLLWSAFAPIDEVTRGEAKVIPSSQVQIIQSVDGGVVEEMLVREGQTVEAGDLLLRIDSTRFVASFAENRSQYFALRAKAARLESLTSGTPLNMPRDVLREAPEIADHERRLYESTVAELDAQLSIARQQLTQRQQELNEVRARHAQSSSGLELVQQELNVTRPLMKSGAVSEVELLRLQRDVARLRGERDQAAAQMSRIHSAISEATRKIQEVELTVRNVQRNELSDTMAKLGALTEGGRALEDRVKHAEVRSPVRGTVKRLLVNTVGGVVQPGKEVVEIVPLDDALILEAQVKPKDIAFLRPGQNALVKFTAYDFAIYGGLDAVVEHIGADTVTDEKGNAFYTVRVRTLKSSLGESLPIIPGMVAEIDILTGKKTILSYLLKPVLRAKANALSER
ncbi:HlyD family type I secretion periplasmic adaptor subunit [Aromatoleum petrolei]|uniref:Membrane fusion protein (MFP) family protein n=1 Tax=Aromatoleum petrolei TaxID=76116 RepID=A0ABX1MUP7_9RHOO|nr:HlyD family type I secretion periplasmic adaptor subunit [Aromatoleum petrolei]NMF90951.1 HlyD family type I secretion periplasmic adaptor subunit [Aromatoleum petrolei]QTQ35986.1 Type I secretion membrane fusion protein, HlyD family [Aromatoleum petrolei]